MKQLKIDLNLFEQEGISNTKIDSIVKYLDNDDKILSENIVLKSDTIEKNFLDKFSFISFYSNYPVKLRILGKGEFGTDYCSFNFNQSEMIRLVYLNPGNNEDIIINFIGLKDE